MNSPQAQAESEHPCWFNDSMTEAEQLEYEKWLDGVWASMQEEETKEEF